MARGVYILGTDTDVGKTIVSAAILLQLRSHGYPAGYYKPISSGGVDKEGQIIGFDARFVKQVTGLEAPDELINPFRFKTPVAPHLAAGLEKQPIELAVVEANLAQLKQQYSYLVIEGCGGLMVPLTAELVLQSELVKRWGIGCIVVARTILGTINHTLLTVKYAQSLGIAVAGIVFSGATGSVPEQENIRLIRELARVPILGVLPQVPGVDVEAGQAGMLTEVCREVFAMDDILNAMNEL